MLTKRIKRGDWTKEDQMCHKCGQKWTIEYKGRKSDRAVCPNCKTKQEKN